MSFISYQYLLFLGIVFLLYWCLPFKGRIVLLIAGSYLFYGSWDTRFVALLLASTTVDYFCGLAIAQARKNLRKVFFTACLPAAWLIGYTAIIQDGSAVAAWVIGASCLFPFLFGLLYHFLWRFPEVRQRRAFLVLSILTNLGVLAFFKYFKFFADNFVALFSLFGVNPGWTLPHIVLPIAISFYTFQSICYSVDIYRNKVEPMKEFLPFAAYLSFFPQLVSGPIERPNHLLPQFQKAASWDVQNLHSGIALILIGLFKKVFVADNCALLANYAFAPDTKLNAYWAILGVMAFAFQVYGDFSGYTDIARGSARLLGIQLSANFRFPYFASNPSDFWRRWHITLSTWFRDYVYIPLGGNHGTSLLTLRNLYITMLLAGLWHGASWTFVLWGAYHGTLLILFHIMPFWQRVADTNNKHVWQRVPSIVLMWILTLIGWSFFRSSNLGQLWNWVAALGNWNASSSIYWVGPSLWWLLHVVPLLLFFEG
jgi:D-alanyl-lipoteichoic acid acyltransferase DltB (MBOAT superfamily)